jgi:hypothetical protein
MFGRNKTQKTVEMLTQNMAQLQAMIAAQQQTIDILYASRTNTRKYKTRKEQVAETRRKYRGGADFGNQIAQRIVNLRVAFSMPNRLFLIKNPVIGNDAADSAVKSTKDYLNAFMELNGLDSSLPRDLAKEAELQGQVAVRLVWDPKEKLPRLKYYPWEDTGYKVEPASKYLINGKNNLVYKDELGKDVKLKDDEFVYIAFNDELNCFEGYPTCGGVLEAMENLDKDLMDWRVLNHLFAHPTPHFKCETSEEAEHLNTEIAAKGWRAGMSIATNSEFELKGTTGVEANLLMLSITTLAKIVSGHTGIAIHYLGFANVMNARATAESAGEPTEIVLHSEISSWNAFYKALFNKALALRNKELNGEIKPGLIIPKIVPLTDRQWDLIKNMWMPLAEKGLISEKTLLEKIPGLDADAEQERIADDEKANERRMKAAQAKLAQDGNQPKPDKKEGKKEEDDEDEGGDEE